MKKILAALTLVLGLAGGMAVLQSESASAWAYLQRAGRPGNVSVPRATFIGVRHGTVPWCCWYVNPSTSTALTVGRAPVAGAQAVGVTYVLQRNSGGWRTVQQRTFYANIAAGQLRVNVRQPNFEYLDANSPTGIYRMAYVIAWANSRGALGRAVVVPDRTSDHWCGAQLRCTLLVGGVNIRGFATD